MTTLYKYVMTQNLFPLKNINMLKILISVHLYYNEKITHMHKISLPIIDFCCLGENTHGGILYYPLRCLGILYSSLAQGILPDDLELYSEAFEIHLTKMWFCTSVLNQSSQGLHPYFSISCCSSIERTESTHSWPGLCTVFLQIWSGWECQDYIFIFIWGTWRAYMFTCNGRIW